MTNGVEPELLTISELFNEPDVAYVIPIYQRNYAWQAPEIEQLIDDVWTAAQPELGRAASSYFLGNLIVARTGSSQDKVTDQTRFDVIDGQQRLTTLLMLLTDLGAQPSFQLTYESRPDASRALERLDSSDEASNAQIGVGYKAIKAKTKTFSECERQTLTQYLLNHVNVVRAKLPDSTDVNKYFEVMNTRGEQLSQVDIIKARLMGYVGSEAGDLDTRRACFAKIWDACAETDTYIQVALTRGNARLRDEIFGDSWDALAIDDFEDLVRALYSSTNVGRRELSERVGLDDAIDEYSRAAISEYVGNDSESNDQFSSPISLPSLLLHTLAVITHPHGTEQDDSVSLDDSKLIKIFDDHFRRLTYKERAREATTFVVQLLRCKFVLDNYVIKRDFRSGNTDEGEWSLRRLKKDEGRGGGNKRSFSYVNAFGDADVDDRVNAGEGARRMLNDELLMLQSMLRVTYTSPRTMHWITEVLRVDREGESSAQYGRKLNRMLRNYARDRAREAFPVDDQPTGFVIERIVFTYLDFLLASTDSDFTFVYRNSIEHFFPQNPDQEQEGWDVMGEDTESIHLLGNLALVSVGKNSKFSNSLPKYKSGYGQSIREQSLKLQVMAGMTESLGSEGRSWDGEAITTHHNEMVDLLVQDFGRIDT